MKKIDKSILNTIAFYLKDDNNEQYNFNGEIVNFTLQLTQL